MRFGIYKWNDMLRGSQDHMLGTIGDKILVVGGFCTALNGVQTPGVFKKKVNPKTSYERGFIKDIFCYCLTSGTWEHIGVLPIKPRQRGMSIVLGDKMHIWGGFSYTPLSSLELEKYKKNNTALPSKANVYSYSDGLSISYKDRKLSYSVPPPLPYPLVSCGLVKYEKERKLFFLNGSLYNRKSFNTFQEFNNVKIGKSFFSMLYDTDNNIIPNSIEYINNFPGSPRHNAITHLVGDYIYVMGGSNTTSLINKHKGYPEYTYHNVMDNWKYDISNNKWQSLNTFPIPMCNQGSITHHDKYIILMGGTKYNTTYLPNGNVIPTKSIKCHDMLPWNGISTIQNKFNTQENTANQYNWYFSNIIMIYDCGSDTFTISDTKLPININNPRIMSYPQGLPREHVLYIIGGEANPLLLRGIYYGNCSSLMLKLNVIDTLAAPNSQTRQRPSIPERSSFLPSRRIRPSSSLISRGILPSLLRSRSWRTR